MDSFFGKNNTAVILNKIRSKAPRVVKRIKQRSAKRKVANSERLKNKPRAPRKSQESEEEEKEAF